LYVEDVKAVSVDHCGVIDNVDPFLLEPIVEMGMAVDEVARPVFMDQS
jgi:hypothetical protein